MFTDRYPAVVAAPLMIYDGDCGFCTVSARWLERGLPPAADVRPWQALDLGALGLTEHDVTTAAWWIDASGRSHRGSRGIARALAASRGWRKAVGWLLLAPPVSWLAVPLYAVVARNRHRMPGATDACRVDQPVDRS